MITNTDETLKKYLLFIHALRNPSPQQKRLAELGSRFIQGYELTPSERRAMNALLQSEKSRERTEAAAAKALHALKSEKQNSRRARTRQLIELGGLVELAQLGTWDKGTLLGAFCHLVKQSGREDWREISSKLKATGDHILAVKEEGKARILKSQ